MHPGRHARTAPGVLMRAAAHETEAAHIARRAGDEHPPYVEGRGGAQMERRAAAHEREAT